MDLQEIALRLAASQEPEAPPWGPFGQWAWASHREGVPEEPDNELEKEVYAQLRKHFASSRTGLPLVTASLLSLLVTTGWYRPVLHPPPYGTLYRGLKLQGRNELASFIGMNVDEEEGSIDFDQGHTVPIVNGWSTSWSFRKGITRDFSEKGKRGWAVTLFADVEPNRSRFLAGPGGLYNVYGLSRWHLEKETVGLEPILIKRIEWNRL